MPRCMIFFHLLREHGGFGNIRVRKVWLLLAEPQARGYSKTFSHDKLLKALILARESLSEPGSGPVHEGVL